MRRVKLGRNIFINLGMIGVTLVSFSFLFLLNTGTAIGDIFGAQQTIQTQFTTSLVEQIERNEPYNIVIQMGDVDVRIQPLAIDELRIDRAYNLEDGFNVRIDDTSRTIFITTIQDVIEEGLFISYQATYDIFIPQTLLLGNITARIRTGEIELDRLNAEEITINQLRGELFIYGLDATSLTVNATNLKARVLDSYFLVVEMNVDQGTILFDQINDIITDGLFFTLNTTSATTTVNDAYFRNYTFVSITGDLFLQNRNTIYQVESIDISTIEGEVLIPLRYESAVVG
jgi:hypothetical protein